MTTVFDAAGEASAKASWVLMRRTRADTFRSASSRKNLYCFSKLHVAEPKNRTCIGPHSRTQKYQRFPSWKPAMSGGLKLVLSQQAQQMDGRHQRHHDADHQERRRGNHPDVETAARPP